MATQVTCLHKKRNDVLFIKAKKILGVTLYYYYEQNNLQLYLKQVVFKKIISKSAVLHNVGKRSNQKGDNRLLKQHITFECYFKKIKRNQNFIGII